VLLDIQMPGINGLETAKRIMNCCPVPIVMCTGYYEDELINSASQIGVFAYVVKPCRLANLLPAMNLAISRFHENRLLRSEVDSLKEALASRKLVEQAKGIVMRTRGFTEDSAHKFLQQESQRQSRSLPELAKAIVLAHQTLVPRIYGETRART
jgi:response regulator NasT